MRTTFIEPTNEFFQGPRRIFIGHLLDFGQSLLARIPNGSDARPRFRVATYRRAPSMRGEVLRASQ